MGRRKTKPAYAYDVCPVCMNASKRKCAKMCHECWTEARAEARFVKKQMVPIEGVEAQVERFKQRVAEWPVTMAFYRQLYEEHKRRKEESDGRY